MNEITATISGRASSSKGTIASVVAAALAEYNIQSNIYLLSGTSLDTSKGICNGYC